MSKAATNIFDYATKELSQDAFLSWVLANKDCDDKDLCDAANSLLKLFEIDPNSVLSIEIKRQERNIDISAYISGKDDENMALYIEDKTTSKEHEQLSKYNESINDIAAGYSNVKKVYYKTSRIDEDEKIRVCEAGWKVIEFDKIANTWKSYLSSDNLIICSYAKHIQQIENDLKQNSYPDTERIVAWESYFSNTLIPELAECTCRIDGWPGQYSCLQIWPKGHDIGDPFFEIRSRDCIKKQGKFVLIGRILTYGIDEKYNDGGKRRKEAKNAIEKGIDNSKMFLKQNYSQQVAISKKEYDTYDTEDEWKKGFKELVKEYLEVMKNFNIK